jgi:hypothetical protein
MLKMLQIRNQQMRAVAGKLRFFQCKMIGGILTTTAMEDSTGRTTACVLRSVVAESITETAFWRQTRFDVKILIEMPISCTNASSADRIDGEFLEV